jgi:hypothetical protein
VAARKDQRDPKAGRSRHYSPPASELCRARYGRPAAEPANSLQRPWDFAVLCVTDHVAMAVMPCTDPRFQARGGDPARGRAALAWIRIRCAGPARLGSR